MSKLLHMEASPRGARSKSSQIAEIFVEAYKKRDSEIEIERLNLFEADIPSFDGLAVQAKYTILHGKKHTEAELEAWKEVERVIEQFKSADKYVLSVPMWNFSIPYRLKQYIDVLVQPGYTFSYSEDKGYQGLVTDKPLAVLYARGGDYSVGSGAEDFDQQSRYIEQIFGFMGFDNIRSIAFEPTLQGSEALIEARRQVAVKKAIELANEF